MGWKFPSEREAKRKALLGVVEDIREALAAGAEEGEETATLPEASVNALYETGLLALKLPEALGGAEADPVTQMEVIEAVSRIDAAAGWCLMIGATSIAWPGAFLPDAAIEEMFPGGHVPRAAASARSVGKATPVDGGYVVDGRWSFASGIRHSQWVNAGALIDSEDESAKGRLMAVIPISQVQVHDNWQVAGLKGTGSNDFSVSNLFVPAEFTWMPGVTPHWRGGPMYLLGSPGFVANEHPAFSVGVGCRALDEIISLSQSKVRGNIDPSSIASRPSFQWSLGEADLKLRAARALSFQVFEKAWDTVCGGDVPGPELQAEMRSCATYATLVAEEVVSMAFRYGGGEALFSSSSLQRCWRDINAAAQHGLVNDTAYENHGQFILGMSGAEPMR
jgi:alkylation response protein AidB-like acyl-CoA dehydrogenase